MAVGQYHGLLVSCTSDLVVSPGSARYMRNVECQAFRGARGLVSPPPESVKTCTVLCGLRLRLIDSLCFDTCCISALPSSTAQKTKLNNSADPQRSAKSGAPNAICRLQSNSQQSSAVQEQHRRELNGLIRIAPRGPCCMARHPYTAGGSVMCQRCKNQMLYHQSVCHHGRHQTGAAAADEALSENPPPSQLRTADESQLLCVATPEHNTCEHETKASAWWHEAVMSWSA